MKFAGYIITSTIDGVSVTPDPGLLDGIRNFPEPTNITELGGFLGMLGQLGDWNPDLAQHCTTMRILLKKGVPWEFTPDMRAEFVTARSAFSDPVRQKLNPFNPAL